MSACDPDLLGKAIGNHIPPEKVASRLVKLGFTAADDKVTTGILLVKATGVKSQQDATVLLVNITGGDITAECVTEILRAGFPKANIGPRHGPHWLSKARTGKLAGVETMVIPVAKKGKRQPAAAPVAVVAATNAPTTIPAAAAAVQAPPTIEQVIETIAEELALEPVVVAPMAENIATLRAKLEALSMKELAAEAKKVGVKAIGKKIAIIDAIIAVT